MKKQKLIDEILKSSTEKKGRLCIACSEVFAITEKFNVTKAEVSKIINEKYIKITNCQLGCF